MIERSTVIGTEVFRRREHPGRAIAGMTFVNALLGYW
jgi:hypothetical protein